MLMFLVFEATLEGKLGLVEEHVITTAVDQASTSPGITKYIVMRNGKKSVKNMQVDMDMQLESGNLNPNSQN